MKTGIKVGDIMTRNFVAVRPMANLLECSRQMVKRRVGSLIIKEDQKFIGLLTEKNILRALVENKNLGITKAKDIMLKKPQLINPSKDIYVAMLKMKKSQVRWLPVIVKNRVIGMITMKDILKIQPTLLDIALQHWQIKEEEEKWKRVKETEDKWIKEGPCEECGAFDILYKIKNRFVCEDCKENLGY